MFEAKTRRGFIPGVKLKQGNRPSQAEHPLCGMDRGMGHAMIVTGLMEITIEDNIETDGGIGDVRDGGIGENMADIIGGYFIMSCGQAIVM